MLEILTFGLGDALTTPFIEAPWHIYPADHLWVPPLKQGLQEELSLANPFFQHGQMRAFIARSGSQIVGRVLASIDTNLVQKANEKIGHFGYFDCIADLTVSTALLDAALRYLQENGCTAVHGPVNLTIMNGYRLQTSGFHTEPFIGEPRHPPYYEELLKHSGFQRMKQWCSWDMTPELCKAAAEYLESKLQPIPGLAMDLFDFTQVENELAAFYPVALETFSQNYGYSAIGARELDHSFHGLIPLLSRGRFALARHENNLVGYSLNYWNIAPLLRAANGDAAAFEMRPVDNAQWLMHTVAIIRSAQRSGLAYHIFADLWRYASNQNAHAIACLIKGGGPKNFLDDLLSPSREYYVFAKNIG